MKTNIIEKRNLLLENAKRRIEAVNKTFDQSEFLRNLVAGKKALGEKIRQENLSRGN